MQLKKVLCDGYEVETTDAGATAITNLQSKLQAAEAAVTDANAAHATALAAKDTELATKDAEIAALKAKVLDAAALDKLVTDRAKLINDAKRLVPDFDGTGKDAQAIKRGVVQAKCGDTAVADKSDDYVNARFDLLLESAGDTDTLRDHVLQGGGRSGSVVEFPGSGNMSAADAAREEEKALAEANDHNKWRTKTA